MTITTRQIDAFRATMLTGSTKSASELLFVTQPVVSRLIAQLEAGIGFTLFTRNGNSLVPNEKAYVLLDGAKNIFLELEKFERIARNIKIHDQGSIKIYCSPTLGTSVIPQIIRIQNKRFGDATFEIFSRHIEKIPYEVISNKGSIGISIWPTNDPGVNCELLAQRNLSIAVHPDSSLSHKVIITPDDLLAERVIAHHQNLPMGRMIAERFSYYSPHFKFAYLIENSEIAYSLVKDNLGVAIIDAFSKNHLENQGLCVIPFDISLKTNLCLITSKTHIYGNALHLIKQSLLEWLHLS